MKVLKKIFIFIISEGFKALFRLLMFAFVVYMAGKIISMETRKPPIEYGTYIELKLKDEIAESKIITPFDLRKEVNFYDFLINIKKAENDPRIEGIILSLENVGLNRAQLEELMIKLREFKSEGKKVYAYAPFFDNRNYLIASVADEIIMPDTAGAISDIKGYSVDIPYFKSLGDRFGLKMNIIHVGDYKSYGENYTRKEMSEEYRENTQRILDKVYDNFVNGISENRKIDATRLNDKILNGDFVFADPETLLRSNLIDKKSYYENFIQEKNIVNKLSIKEYKARLAAEKEEKEVEKISDKIAIIYAEGTINYFEDSKKMDEIVTPERIKKELDIAEKNSDIKGIIIRVNSPGGSALASDIIYESIKKITKPVYISMGGVAASGGYYMSAAGDKIYADNETLTGSIGVVTMIPNASEFVKKVDVNFSSIQKGKYSDIGSPVKEMTEDEKDKIYASSYKIYNEFVDKVAEGRKLNRQDVLKIAEGRVWLGEEAKKIGLVDEIGGIDKTIEDLAKDLKLEKYEIIESPKEEKLESVIKNYLPKYLMAKVLSDNTVSTIVKDNLISDELLYKPVLYAPNIDIK